MQNPSGDPNVTAHTYGMLNKFNRGMFLVLSVLLIILGIVSFVGSIHYFIDRDFSAAWNFLGYFLGCAVLSPVVFIQISYLMSDIKTKEDGLQTKFIFKNLDVNWKDIIEVKLAKPFGLRVGRKANVLIVRNGLTWFHRLYGILYGQTNQPALLIWSNISGYDALVKKVMKNRKKK
jgi:hypothetical protein